MFLYVKWFLIAEKKTSWSAGQSLWGFWWLSYVGFARFYGTLFIYGGYEIVFLEKPIVKNSAEFFLLDFEITWKFQL